MISEVKASDAIRVARGVAATDRTRTACALQAISVRYALLTFCALPLVCHFRNPIEPRWTGAIAASFWASGALPFWACKTTIRPRHWALSVAVDYVQKFWNVSVFWGVGRDLTARQRFPGFVWAAKTAS